MTATEVGALEKHERVYRDVDHEIDAAKEKRQFHDYEEYKYSYFPEELNKQIELRNELARQKLESNT